MPLRRILTLNVLGLLILLSWWQTALPIWPWLNNTIYFGFNATYTPDHPIWNTLIAALNTRYYDVGSFLLMMLVLLFSLMEDDRLGRLWHWFGVGFVMLATAALISLLNHKVITYGHPSPTFYYHAQGMKINRLPQLVSFATKDSSGQSFPGDHGMMLMVFAAYMMRFAKRHWAVVAVIMVPIFSLPRIMVGAHWFEDVWMGSFVTALVVLPWIIMTPLAATAVAGIERLSQRLGLPFSVRTATEPRK